MKKFLIIISLFSILASCSLPLKFTVQKTGYAVSSRSQQLVYSLPRDLVRISFDIEKENYIPGPYYQFTERLLGLKDYIREYGVQYRITGVNTGILTEPDPDMFYTVQIKRGSFEWEKYMNLTSRGFILDPSRLSNYPVTSESGWEGPSSPFFNDQAINLNLKEVTDTLFKTIVTDTSLIRLPVVTTARQVRTLEQKAEEAARNLFAIREARFFLITNTEGGYPDGKALEIMIAEMSKMEKSYLELFTGRVVTRKFTRNYVLLPDGSSDLQTEEIARFSPVNGLVESGSGLPVRVEIRPLNNFKGLQNQEDTVEGEEVPENLLYYRIPDQANIRVLLENQVLYNGRMHISQCGAVIGIPVK